MGFEVVCDTLLDGMADRTMMRLLELGKDGTVAIIAPEDMIADRMGQYASGSAPEMLGQARALYRLCKNLDMAFMGRPIWEGGFQRKRQAPMAFKTLQTKSEPMTLETLAQSIARRRAAAPEIIVPRNSGTRRTVSKQALLDEIAKTGVQW